MKKNSIILMSILLSIFAPTFLWSQDNNNWKIKKGEKLSFKVAFSSGLTGDMKGGEATMTVQNKTVKIGEKDAYHAVMIGKTTGVIEWFYSVDNKYESYIDANSNSPLLYIQNTHENKYQSKDTVRFDQTNKTASFKGKKIEIPVNTQDFLSVFYYARALDMSKIKKGDTFKVPYFTGSKVAFFTIIYNGLEKIKTKKMGEVSCYSFKPQVPTGKMFKDQYPATMWISADNRRLPILIDAKMRVGKMKLELLTYE